MGKLSKVKPKSANDIDISIKKKSNACKHDWETISIGFEKKGKYRRVKKESQECRKCGRKQGRLSDY